MSKDEHSTNWVKLEAGKWPVNCPRALRLPDHIGKGTVIVVARAVGPCPRCVQERGNSGQKVYHMKTTASFGRKTVCCCYCPKHRYVWYTRKDQPDQTDSETDE